MNCFAKEKTSSIFARTFAKADVGSKNEWICYWKLKD